MSFERSKIPIQNEEIKFTLNEIKNFTLQNGLKVLFIEREFLPILRMNLIANCGSFFDPADKKGLANLLGMMLDEGAGDYNSLELSEEFDILGSSFSINCNHDNIFLSLRTLTENFERSLELVSNVILKPHFKEEDFQRERRKIEVKLIQQKDEPEELAYLAFGSIVHGKNNPYSFPTLGFNDSINNLSVDEVITFYNNYFNPNNSYLIITGDLAEGKLNYLLEEYLGKWKPKSQKTNPTFESALNKNTVYILHKEGAVQTEIRIGHQSSKRKTPDYFPKTVMNMILGGQFTSRLNLNLREAKGFTYGITSNFSYHKNCGEFCISTSVSTENTLAAVNEILCELDRIKSGVKAEELDFAKISMIRKFPSHFESDSQIVSNLSMLAIHDLPKDYFNNYIHNISKVTIEEVKHVTHNSLKLNELSIVMVGDKQKLVADFGDVKIINERGQQIN